MLSLLLAVITTIGASFLFSFLDGVLNTSVKGFSIFIIVPIGAMLFGFVAVSGMALGRRISKSRIKKFYIPAAMLAGFLAFFVSMGVDYYNFYNEARGLFYAQIEESASELSEDERKEADKLFNEKINFLNYFKEMHENTTVSISSRSGKSAEFKNPIMSIFSFWSTVVGSAIGGLILAKIDIGERTKNTKTKRYQDLKFRKNFDFYDFEDVKSMIYGENAANKVVEYINIKKSEKSVPESKSHIVLRILSERNEGIGEIILEKAEVIKVGNESKTDREKFLVEISKEDVEKIIQSLKDIGIKERF